jgi:hypothetical protein
VGLFSSERKVYVASSLWNLAGDPDKIPRVLPSVALSAALSGSREGLGQALSSSLRSGAFQRSRRFFRWAQDDYVFGMPTGSLGADFSVAAHEIGPALKTALGLGSDQELEILSAQVEELYLGHWAEDWVRRNRPGITLDLGVDQGGWDVAFDATSETLVIQLPGETQELPAPADLLWALEETEGPAARRLLYVAYRIQTRNPVSGAWSTGPNELFTYRMGSGTAAFDALTPSATELEEFVPAIPLRLKNQSIRDHAEFENVTIAFKKLTGGKIDDVLDELEDHNKIDDMDFVFVVQGIPLNTKSRAGQAYIYQFLKNLMALQPVQTNSAIFYANRGKNGKARASWEAWLAQIGAGATPAPPSSLLARDTEDAKNVLRVHMPGLKDFDLRLKWGVIAEEVRSGNAARFDGVSRPLMKKGEYWFTVRSDLELQMPNAPGLLAGWTRPRSQRRMVALHQFEARRYRLLEITEFKHVNTVFKQEAVEIGAREALEDGELSGFILPLHIPTLRQLGAAKAAELAGHSCHVMVNSYKVVTTRWYQKGVFKIVLVVMTIAFSVLTAGAGLGAGVGLLGTNAAVGAMVGVTGAMSAVVGAVVNGVAGVLLMTGVAKASTEVLGDKWGAILAQVIAVVTLQMATSIVNAGNLPDWGAMLRIDNLMKLTEAVTSGAGTWLQNETLEIQQALASASETYADRIAEVEAKTAEILGSTPVAFDAMLLTDAAEHFGETRDAFLTRTLMVGGDLAEMSALLIESFADLSLELPGRLP